MTEVLIEKRAFPGKRFVDQLSGLIWRAKTIQKPKNQLIVSSVVFVDNAEHLPMLPEKGSTHVPGVPRYDSGFRNYHPLAKNSKS